MSKSKTNWENLKSIIKSALIINAAIVTVYKHVKKDFKNGKKKML